MHQTTRRQNKKERFNNLTKLPMHLFYTLSVFTLMEIVYVRSFPVYVRTFPTSSVFTRFGSLAFLLTYLVSEPYIVCSHVAGYRDDITQV